MTTALGRASLALWVLAGEVDGMRRRAARGVAPGISRLGGARRMDRKSKKNEPGNVLKTKDGNPETEKTNLGTFTKQGS